MQVAVSNGLGNEEEDESSRSSIRAMLAKLTSNKNPKKQVIPLGLGDPATYPCFRVGQNVAEAVVKSLTSGKYNTYAPSFGIADARRAVAEYLSEGVPKGLGLVEEDVYMTVGGSQAIEICLAALGRGKRGPYNILMPKPGFLLYQNFCALNNIEPRFYHLLPQSNWEVDLDGVRHIADDNTLAIVVINPNNPCGAVYSRYHLQQIAEVAGKLKVPVVSDEIYGHIVFGGSEFVPMVSFASITPIITIGGLSKRFLVPGWRLGWIALSKPQGSLKQTRIKEDIEKLMNVIPGPSSFIQVELLPSFIVMLVCCFYKAEALNHQSKAALPSILSDSNQHFHENMISLLGSCADACYSGIERIKALYCPSKPRGSMFIMVKVQISLLSNVNDDVEFATELMKEESVLVLPGSILGLKDWVRIHFGAPPEILEEALDRIESFCERHKNCR
ncbi:hypothetical protein AMTRI_Chr04g184320 [Amborella trichopoda]